MPPDIPNNDDIEVTESRDVVEKALSEPEEGDMMADAVPTLKTVSWFRQLSTVLKKNMLLLSRRPITLTVMILSSIVGVLFAWLAGRTNTDFGQVPLTDCGTVTSTYYDSLNYTEQAAIPISYNDAWRDSLPVSLLCLGPLMMAISCFLIVHEEMTLQMLGVLRGLGLRDSVYWMSWWIPFTGIALVNSLLGAIVAKLISLHAFETIYFGGIFGSLFFLQLGMIGTSLFCAAVCGSSRRGSPWLILVMLLVMWVPYMAINGSSYYISGATSVTQYGVSGTPTGLFWVNLNTTWYSFSDGAACDKPLVSEEQANWWKTEEEREEFASSPDDYFIGCYFGAGYSSYFWNPPGGKIGSVILFLFPYTHMMTIWSNFLGYTGMPDRTFSFEQASMSTEELAVASLAVPPNEANAKGSSLHPQGSMFNLGYEYESDINYYDDEGNLLRKDNCPAQNASAAFCPNINQCVGTWNPAPTSSPSTNQMFGYLVVLAVLYTLLAAYWAIVLPGRNGARQKFYFFLLPSYWCGASRKSGDETDESNLANDAAVAADQVVKRYGDFEALRGVSIQMQRGEVTGLLGHNGAGKTTLSSIICCETPPSSGDCSVFGYSVTKNPFAVRNLVGICKQDDYLYPDLSAKEHLQLFAGLRGVPKKQVPETVQKWLESVDLATIQNQYSKSFSGGMKRRLSVACSTIGDRPCIVLDEPTTGMDPVSRRAVWGHIEEIKEGRVVLLTTHAMEEADLLCDSVAIMRKGELAAFGTPLELKSEYGSALQFALLVEKDDAAATKDAIVERFSKSSDFVDVDAGEAGNITVKIQKVRQEKDEDGVDVDELTSFVSWLEGDDSAVTEYGFSNSSLEEVFLAVTKGDDEEGDDDDGVDVCCSCCCAGCISCCLSGPCRCCCRPKPRSSKTHVSSNGSSDQETDDDQIDLDEAAADESNGISSYKPKLTIGRQSMALFRFSLQRSWTGKGSIANYCIYGLFALVIIMVGIFTAGSNSPPIPALVVPTALLSLMLLNMISSIYADRQLDLFYLIRSQGLLKDSYLLGTSLYSLTVTFAYAFVALSLFFAMPLFRSPSVCPQDEFYTGSCVHNNGDPPVVYPVPISWWDDTFNGEQVELYAAPTTGSYGRIFGAAALFSLTMPGAVFASSYIPGFKLAIVVVLFISLFASVAPLIFYFGTNGQDYDEILECASNICEDPSSISSGSLGTAAEDFLNCVGLGVNSASLGSLCLKPVSAILPQFGLFQTLAMTVISDIIFVSEPPEYVEQVLIPSLGNDVKCSGNTCTFPYTTWLYGVNLGFMAVGAALLLVVGVIFVSIFSFPGGITLRVKSWFSHMCCKLNLARSIRSKRSNGNDKSNGVADPEPTLEEVTKESEYVQSVVKPLLKEPDPEEVEEGTENVEIVDHDAIARDNIDPVLMYKLRKVYPGLGGLPPKVALNSLDLHVSKGQVLGLLGKNGAGKTTALKILSVSHEATAGIALVAGFDVSCEQLQVFERLGTCPQFDIVYKGLSVQRHLEFLAMLKGLPNKKVKEIALSIAKAVGLGAPAVYRRNAGALSGGMRRRLSIAMSLIGAPSVLLLDEPSTGLDPSTRNSIWGLVSSFATDERAIIITTHMMIEADALCNRIAIVSRGSLKVVGTQQHLKDEFGSGYLLQLNLMKSTPENQSSAMAFVQNYLSADAVLQTKQAKTLHISLPRDIDLTTVFKALYSPESRTEGCINQFLLSQSSLEDVFVALGD